MSLFLVAHDPSLTMPAEAKAALQQRGKEDLGDAAAAALKIPITKLKDRLLLTEQRFLLAMGSSAELTEPFEDPHATRGITGFKSEFEGEDIAVWFVRTKAKDPRIGATYTATIFLVATAGCLRPARTDQAAWGWRNAKGSSADFVGLDDFLEEYIPRAKEVKAFA
jgi:hypothetical protein